MLKIDDAAIDAMPPEERAATIRTLLAERDKFAKACKKLAAYANSISRSLNWYRYGPAGTNSEKPELTDAERRILAYLGVKKQPDAKPP